MAKLISSTATYVQKNMYQIANIWDLCKRVDALSAQVEDLTRKPAPSASKVDTDAKILVVNEIEEHEKRSKNIRIFNLTESPATTSNEAAMNDEEKIDEIGKILGTEIERMKTIWIGKKEVGKVQPLKVIVPNRIARDSHLSRAKKTSVDQKRLQKTWWWRWI